MRYSDAIAAVTGRWLEREADAIVFGEEVANLGGGAYGATKGLVERFPDRVINTPISEGGFSGLGFGAAMLGMRVVVEIMFADFALVAADQLFNQLSKARHMYGDTTDLPIVVRQPGSAPGSATGRSTPWIRSAFTGCSPASGSSLRPTRTTISVCSTPPCTRSIRWSFWSTTPSTRSGRRRRPATWTTPSPSARRAPCRTATRSPC